MPRQTDRPEGDEAEVLRLDAAWNAAHVKPASAPNCTHAIGG